MHDFRLHISIDRQANRKTRNDRNDEDTSRHYLRVLDTAWWAPAGGSTTLRRRRRRSRFTYLASACAECDRRLMHGEVLALQIGRAGFRQIRADDASRPSTPTTGRATVSTAEELVLGDYLRPRWCDWGRQHCPAPSSRSRRCGRRSSPTRRWVPGRRGRVAPRGACKGPWIGLGTRCMGRRGGPGRCLLPDPKWPVPDRRTPIQSLLTRRFLAS